MLFYQYYFLSKWQYRYVADACCVKFTISFNALSSPLKYALILFCLLQVSNLTPGVKGLAKDDKEAHTLSH